MRKYAILQDNVVSQIVELEETQLTSEQYRNVIVIDIHDFLIQPQLGWVLQGNQLVPGPGQNYDVKELIKNRVKHYQERAPELLRTLYAENTLLGITAEQSNAMFTDYQDVLIRIREGAFPTALYCLSQKSPSGFVTQQMIDDWYDLIEAEIIT